MHLYFSTLVWLLHLFQASSGQSSDESSAFKQKMREGVLALDALLDINPTKESIYSFDYPTTDKYIIGMLIDPCRLNSYNCCINVFGTAEYPVLIASKLESERVVLYDVIASDTEVSSNYILVDEHSMLIPTSAQRSSDDFQVFDTGCIAKSMPYTYCAGRNFAFRRSDYRPPCSDNNSSLDALQGCYCNDGTLHDKCVTVAYTTTTFIPQCQDNASISCGTYLEVHMDRGTPYQLEDDIISQVKIDNRNVSGYYSLVLPLTWMSNHSKVLCSYSESKFRIGSLVYIQASAPVCCCPPPFTSSNRVGSFQCPIGPFGTSGVLSYHPQTIAEVLSMDKLVLDYPFCHIDVSADFDQMMCSVYDPNDRRHYTRQCTAVVKASLERSRSWTSIDLGMEYDGECPYFDSCGITMDLGKCGKTDQRFTFIGRVGVVTKLDNLQVVPTAWVSFNNGRTSYEFNQKHVKLETTPISMYEVWWVVRSPSGQESSSSSSSTVLKKKGFNVTSPKCTFDTNNDRYLPYALIQNGAVMESTLLSYL